MHTIPRSRNILVTLLVVIVILITSIQPVSTYYVPGIPPAVDPGTPTFTGLANPVPAEPAAYDPTTSMLQAIYDADMAAGGTSFWFDRLLEQPGSTGGSYLWTKGRALYMYSHSVGTLGFAGGYAYRERPTGSSQNMYTVTIPGVSFSETSAQRRQYPSHWSSVHTSTSAGLRVEQKKFITYNNVAVTVLTITNTGTADTTRTITVASPIATIPSQDGSELTGTVNIRYNLTQIFPRLSGDGFAVSGTSLVRTVTIPAGQSVTLKVQLGAIAKEIPESQADYDRFRAFDPNTAFLTQIQEFNHWWVDNVAYVDLPDQNVKKMSYYRTFLNRYNYVDANIPGNDFQFPVSIEGILGYNNAIQLTQPMHMQDLKYFRDPMYSYGNWLSSGESSKYGPFTDNMGDTAHWGVGSPNGSYEQYIAREAWNSYKVHGGQDVILQNLARYAEGDVKGHLAKYDGNHNWLIEYAAGALTGNDADAVALAYYGRAQDRTETAFWYSGAKAAAEIYARLGDQTKAEEMAGIAANIQNAILTNLWDDTDTTGGKVFKMKDVLTGNLVPWKDQQNFSPFTEGLVPNEDNYKLALRFYADKAEYPIMPSYTANQRDKAAAVAAGKGGSNNFSNINSTLQAQLYARALREYPSQYITPDMYRKLIEWMTWIQYIGGDNRYPDNNEYFYNFNPTTMTMSRSSIHHNILGAFNFTIFEDVAGMQPRVDNIVELWPIDMGYDYFTVNNLSYHSRDLTIVWDRPDGNQHYPTAPEGYSVYLNGQRAFTVDDLVHLTWDPTSGDVTILDGIANVLYNASTDQMLAAEQVNLSGNVRVVDMFQKAGVDLTAETGGLPNLALGRPVSASFVTTSPTLQATAPEYAVDGFTVSGLPVQVGSWIATNPIWGTLGSPNAQDWLAIDLGAPASFDTVKLYFFSNKSFGLQGNTYREPSRYTMEYYDGTDWVRVPEQYKGAPQPNYNLIQFNAITAQHVRVRMSPTPGYGIGLKEIQIFNTGIVLPPKVNQPPAVSASQDASFKFPLKAALIGTVTDDELVYEWPEVTWSLKTGPGLVSFADAHATRTKVTFSTAGTYVLTLTAYDGAFTVSSDVTVVVSPLPASVNLATLAAPSTSYVSSWENLYAINDGYEPANSRDKGPGAYGNWNAGSSTQWVQYTWPEEVVIDRSDVYWWTDGGGIMMPTASRLDYWDGTAWVPAPNAAGNGVLPDRYNTTTFSPVKTKQIRMTITRGSQWTGILEWKVFQAAVQSVAPVEVKTLNGQLPALPPTVTALFLNNITQEKSVIWNTVTPEQVQNAGTSFTVTGAVDVSSVPAEATVNVFAAYVSNDLASQTAQYSDPIQPVTITAEDQAADVPFLTATPEWSSDGLDFQPGLPDGLALNTGDCMAGEEYGSCTYTLTGKVGVQSGSYLIRVAVSDGRGASSTDVAIQVMPENASILYSGEAIAQIGKNLTLRATVWDSAAAGYPGLDPDAALGDITKMWVAFDLYPQQSCMSGTPVQTLFAQVTDGVDAGDGIGTAEAVLTSANEASFCAVAWLVAGSTGGTNAWYTADRAESAVLIFYEPSGQFATGGGWIKDPDGGKGNLGFNSRYLKKGQPQGHLTYIYRGTYNGEVVDFVIKSTAINSLAFNGKIYPIGATLQGKATIQIIRASDGVLLYSEGGATFQATVVDNGDKSGVDSFALLVYNKNGLVFKNVQVVPLEGGNIIAHQ